MIASGKPTLDKAKPILSVKDLHVTFPIRRGLFRREATLVALDGVSFDLKPGETLGLVGESGSGKSTLGRAVLRLLPRVEGHVTWLGQDLAGLTPEALRRLRADMQIVFQDPLASLDPRMPVGEIVAEPLRTFQPDLPKKELRARVTGMLARVGLGPEHLDRYPHEFSGGQCQRIGIARAMINRPKLVICDEPVSALDVSIQAQIINLLMKLQREDGLALIFISHNLSVVRHISHRIMVLYLGRVAELADRRALFREPRHPYTQALISAVPLPDPERERARRHLVLKGELPSPLDPPSGCAFRTRCPKATAICAAERPALEVTPDGHSVACHHWREGPRAI
ncbi:ABC transporter ATP-binding protein [Hypericibacter terrae]|uniref:ABC transporter ATP-binding protein n=1 Tax=Hypericibacter terrae TaxID=2602015 RepID=A0A5J6MNS0_9PROT|nr:dipeptide ABC transporter ATP-binding protein [Hypericibacter terrae]QEX18881.1 ABC transporter ATP-binding protein [Hypericibacter terrae]